MFLVLLQSLQTYAERRELWLSQHTPSGWGWPSTIFSTLLCFLLMISLFKMALKQSSEVLTGVPIGKKAVMWFMEKIPVRWTSFRHELQCCQLWVNDNESTIQHIWKKEEESHKSVHEVTPESTRVTSALVLLSKASLPAVLPILKMLNENFKK